MARDQKRQGTIQEALQIAPTEGNLMPLLDSYSQPSPPRCRGMTTPAKTRCSKKGAHLCEQPHPTGPFFEF